MKKIIFITGVLGLAAGAQAACFSTGGTAAGGAIALSSLPNFASRVSGVAPLAVFFDSAGTTAAGATRPFHELAYCWDFGDPGSGTFSTDGKSKNEARGPVAGHVFETPGTYTITLEVRDNQDRRATRSVVVTVQDPEATFGGANTACLSASGNFTGCPAGAVHVTSGDLASLQPHVGTNRRLLLHRGETFTTSWFLDLNAAGPGLVGAYGTGDVPWIVNSLDNAAIKVGKSDWRVADVGVMGNGVTSQSAPAIHVLQAINHVLLLRCRTTGLRGGFTSADVPDVAVDVLAIQETVQRDLLPPGAGVFGYIIARRFLMLGNDWWNSRGGEHVLRTPYIGTGVISHNDLGDPARSKSIMKIHGPDFAQYGLYTERVVASENIFRAGAEGGPVAFEEGNPWDERVRDVIVERNLFLAGPTVIPLLYFRQAINSTVRDNLFVNVGADPSAEFPIELRSDGHAPGGFPSTGIAILHNTCYAGTSSPSSQLLLNFYSSADEGSAFNNLVVRAGAPTPILTWSGDLGQLSAQSNNVLTTNPGFVSSNPLVWQDFALTAGSPAVNAGAALHWSPWDFTGLYRVPGATPDAGAFELSGPVDLLAPARPANLRVR